MDAGLPIPTGTKNRFLQKLFTVKFAAFKKEAWISLYQILFSLAFVRSMHHAFVASEVGVVNFFGRLGPVIEELRWEAQRALSALDQKAGQ